MAKTDYKIKYLDIRAKLLDSTDVAYRLGFEAGLKEGKQAAAEQQQQQQMEAQQAMAMQQQQLPPEEGGEMPPEEMPSEEMAPEMVGDEEGGSELDSQINELEGLVAKGEKPSLVDLRKVVGSLSNVRKSQKAKWSKKIDTNNSAQKKLVNDILSKWETESKSVSDNLEERIKEHGLKV